MKVANLIEEGRWAGPQKRITMVAHALKQHDVNTVVLLPEQESVKFTEQLDVHAVEYIKLPLHRLGKGWTVLLVYALTFLLDIFRLWRVLRKNNFHLLHVSGGAWQIKGPIAGKLAGVPVIWHLNDTQMPKILVFLFKFLGRLANCFFVAARRVEEYYIENTQLSVIPVHLVPAPILLKQSQIKDSEFLDLDEFQKPVIISVANINPIKGFEMLIDTAERLKNDGLKFSVIIVGPVYDSQKHYFDYLKNLINEKNLNGFVFFVGSKSNIPQYLASSDIYVCSSVAEASPMAVWEAMGAGCAIVSTDVGDVAEHIVNGKSGFIVNVGDVTAMADAILKLIGNKALRDVFSKKVLQIAEKEFDIAVVAGNTYHGYVSTIQMDAVIE